MIDFEDLKRPLYRVKKVHRKYFVLGKEIQNNYVLSFLRMIKYKKDWWKRHYGRISNSPGIYGIFIIDKRNKNNIGKCLYIGQSVNIKRRREEHKKQIAMASNQLKGIKSRIKSKRKRNALKWKDLINTSNCKHDKKYYYLADFGTKNIKFISLLTFDKNRFFNLSKENRDLLLTIFEQKLIDEFLPKLNVIAARPTNSYEEDKHSEV